MNQLDYIHIKLNNLKDKLQDLPFAMEDLRSAYFGYSWDILNNYYWSLCTIQFTGLINKGYVIFDQEAFKDFEHHISRLREITQHEVLFSSARNNTNRALLVDSWSNFEFCITFLCDYILDEDEKEQLLAEQSDQVKKIIKGKELSDEEVLKIKKLLVKKHLSHVSVNRKIDKLFKHVNGDYSGDIKQDKEFLSFLGRYRNCMHSNYIFHGADFAYAFKGTHFIFRNGEAITHNKQLDFTHHFDLALELNDIFERMFVSIKHDTFIPCPLED